MAFNLQIPLPLARMRLWSGDTYSFVLSEPDTLHLNTQADDTARLFAEYLQKEKADKGKLRSIAEEIRSGDFTETLLTVRFSSSKDRISHPAFSLDFACFTGPHGEGFLTFLPALGIQTYSRSRDTVSKRAEEAVRLEFSRANRLRNLQGAVETVWYREAAILSRKIEVSIPSPTELAEKDSHSVGLLKQIAEKSVSDTQMFYGDPQYLQQTTGILQSTSGRSMLIIGNSGAGKTALIRETARQKNEIGYIGQIWETTASRFLSGLSKQGNWQDNAAVFIKEWAEKEVVLYVENLANLFEVGRYEGNDTGIAEFLLPYIARGEVTLLSECTVAQAVRLQNNYPGLFSIFQIIALHPPVGDKLTDVIFEKTEAVGRRYGLTTERDAAEEAVRLHQRFLPYSGMPGKPMRFLENLLLRLRNEDKTHLNADTVVRAFASDSGMPRLFLDPRMRMDTHKIENDFNRRIFGQPTAVRELVRVLAAVKTNLMRPQRPLASMIFIGPTGVGKTELCKVLAEFIFGNRNRLLRFDMSEFSDATGIHNFVGRNSNSLLTTAVRRQPFSVILFDEAEKAHPAFFDYLLQILDAGRLSDGNSQVTDFSSSIIIMTSNLGAAEIQNKSISFGRQDNSDEIKQQFIRAVEKEFRPELFNRIDRIVPFEPLDTADIRQVLDRELNKLRRREGFISRNAELNTDDAAKEYLARIGYDSKYGARGLQRVLHERITIPAARELNAYSDEEQIILNFSMREDRLHLTVKTDPIGFELMLESLEKITASESVGQRRDALDRLEESFSWIEFSDRLNDAYIGIKQENEQTAAQASVTLQKLSPLNETALTLRRRITALEDEIGLVVMDLHDYRPDITERTEEWEKDFLSFKADLAVLVNPEAHRTILYIYGKGKTLSKLIWEYREVASAFGLRVEINWLWYRPEYYHQKITNDAGNTKMRREFVRVRNDYALPVAAKANEQLFGAEITIIGNLAAWIFAEESGIQEHQTENPTEFYRVSVNEEKAAAEVLRRNFYKGTVRRTITEKKWKDTVYKIDAVTDNPSEVLQAVLKEKLQEKIERNL